MNGADIAFFFAPHRVESLEGREGFCVYLAKLLPNEGRACLEASVPEFLAFGGKTGRSVGLLT